MADRDYIALVADLVKDAENYRNNLSQDRITAIEYYNGEMNDTPSDAGRSAVVSRDVRAAIQKVLPSLSRVFLANEKIVEYQPAMPGDEPGAEQATDYVNSVVFVECNGPRIIRNAIHDALKTRNYAIDWEYEEKKSIKVSGHTGLDEDAFAMLVADEGVEVLEHTERQQQVDGQNGPEMATFHDCKIKRTIIERKPRVECFPLEELLMHTDGIDEENTPLIGRKRKLRRSDLVAMGYDKDLVDRLPFTGADGKMEDAETQERRENVNQNSQQNVREIQEIDFFNLYVRIDTDGDGIAELRRMRFGGQISKQTLLEDEYWDDVQIAIGTAKDQPHQWEGVSLHDDLSDVQKINTVLLRQTMDSLYWANNPQMGYRVDLVEPESLGAVTNPQFGQGIALRPGGSAQEALQPIIMPFVADKSFPMIEYWKREGSDRTGITEASGGLPPDALQNTTAKATALIEQQGIGQAEMMAQVLSQGFRRMFRGLLKLIIKHQDKPRTVRLRNQWVEFDPRQWNADMDCVVNTGLGAGTRERDVMIMSTVLGTQKEVLAAFGPDNPYVTPQNLGNALFKFIEASGLRTPDAYFSKPTEEQIAKMAQDRANKPDPEMQKVQAQVQGKLQEKQMDVQAQIEKEKAQAEWNTQEVIARAKIEAEQKNKELALQKYQIDVNASLELLKMNQQRKIDAEDRAMQAQKAADEQAAKDAEDSAGESDGMDANANILAMMDRLMGFMTQQSEMNSRPRVVTTPDGETFTMGYA